MSVAPRPAFVVFSDDWGEHLSSCQHIFKLIARDATVVWVNTIGMRAPKISLTDVGKIWRKGRKMLGLGAAAPAHSAASLDVVVRQPFMLPYSNLGLVRRFNAISVERTIRSCLEQLGVANPTIVATVPNACDYVDGLGAGRVVYYCVDDFAEWPGHQHDLVRSMEARLIERADALVATSTKLYERLRKSGKPTSLLTHGVDMELFAARGAPEHPVLAGIPAPRAGYFGLFDERSDQDLIAALAGKLPNYSFVFAGPVVTSVARLERLPNVHFTGPLPYAELPQFIAGMKALLIPYAVNEFADSLSPLKLKEYLATGKPIVSTPIADMRQWRGEVAVAAGVEEWEAALLAASSEDVAARQERARRLLAGDTWRDKAAELLAVCGWTDAASAAVQRG